MGGSPDDKEFYLNPGLWNLSIRGWRAKLQFTLANLMHPRPQRAACFRGSRGLAISEKLASEDPNNTTDQRCLISDYGNLCESLAYAGEFSEVPVHRETAIAVNQLMVNTDTNNAQARADLGKLEYDHGIGRNFGIRHSRE